MPASTAHRSHVGRVLPSSLLEQMRQWRHDRHAHPETAFEELRTSQRIAGLLEGIPMPRWCRARCTPAATTDTPRCCWARPASCPRTTAWKAMCTSSSNLRKRMPAGGMQWSATACSNAFPAARCLRCTTRPTCHSARCRPGAARSPRTRRLSRSPPLAKAHTLRSPQPAARSGGGCHSGGLPAGGRFADDCESQRQRCRQPGGRCHAVSSSFTGGRAGTSCPAR